MRGSSSVLILILPWLVVAAAASGFLSLMPWIAAQGWGGGGRETFTGGTQQAGEVSLYGADPAPRTGRRVSVPQAGQPAGR